MTTLDDGTVICGECGAQNIIPANLREVMDQRDAAQREIARLRGDVNKIAAAVRQFAEDVIKPTDY